MIAAKKLIKPDMRSKKAVSVSLTTLSTILYPHSFLYSGSDGFFFEYFGTEKIHLLESAVIKTAGNSAKVVEISTATVAKGKAEGACKAT